VPPPPLLTLPYRTKYSGKYFPIQYTPSSSIFFCRSPGILRLICYQIFEIKKLIFPIVSKEELSCIKFALKYFLFKEI
jgi:hypothetical protein